MLYLFFIKNSNRNVIVGASTLTAGNIKKGVKIFNVTGTFTGWVDNSIVMFQNGTLVQNSNLGGTVTYNAGTWWGNNGSWFTGGGSWSQGTNIVLKLTTDCNKSSTRAMYHGARIQFGPINVPTFKSFTMTYSWYSKQNWGTYGYFCWGSQARKDYYELQDRGSSYGYISLWEGIGNSGSGTNTVSHNLHNYLVNGEYTWWEYVDIKVFNKTPTFDTANEATITITKITLNKSTV